MIRKKLKPIKKRPINKEKYKKPVSFRLDNTLIRRLKQLSAILDITVTELVYVAIRDMLERFEEDHKYLLHKGYEREDC